MKKSWYGSKKNSEIISELLELFEITIVQLSEVCMISYVIHSAMLDIDDNNPIRNLIQIWMDPPSLLAIKNT